MTELLYMNGFNIETCTAQVQAINNTEDGRIDVILGATSFYARGGGQDWDTGIIQKEGALFIVEEVRLDEHGDVHHIGKYSAGSFAVGDHVSCIVDHERRSINTRLHSAGHLVDMAVDALKFPWVPGKGAHYPHMSFVEYAGSLNVEESDSIKQQIELQVNKFVAAATMNNLAFMSVDELNSVCCHVPTNIPTNKPVRVVTYGENFGIPCGGTHVHNLAEVGMIKITKVKGKGGIIKVSYGVEGIN